MNIEGKTLVFKNDYGYSTAISKKNADGTYDKMYISLQLPKETELNNATFIDVEDGFLSFYKDKNGIAKPKIVVKKYKESEIIQKPDYMQMPELPF